MRNNIFPLCKDNLFICVLIKGLVSIISFTDAQFYFKIWPSAFS